MMGAFEFWSFSYYSITHEAIWTEIHLLDSFCIALHGPMWGKPKVSPHSSLIFYVEIENKMLQFDKQAVKKNKYRDLLNIQQLVYPW